MASIKKRKDKNGKIRYHVQIRLKGAKPQHGSFERLTDAKDWIQQTESAIKEGRYFKKSEESKHTLGELIDRYIESVLPTKPKSERKQSAQLIWWKKQIGSLLLKDVTPALITEQKDILASGITQYKKRRSSSTVVRYLAALSHALSTAIKDWGWLEDHPMRRISKPKEPRGRIRYLSDEERLALTEACKNSPNPYLFIVYVVALSTGMRKSEILNLRWNDIDLNRGRIYLYETKNNEIRQVPVTGLALDLLKEHATARLLHTKLLFPGKDHRKPTDIRGAWETAVEQAGIKDFKFHDLRHSTASYLAMSGATPAEIGAILGHKTLAMVKRYCHIGDSHTEKVISKMTEQLFG